MSCTRTTSTTVGPTGLSRSFQVSKLSLNAGTKAVAASHANTKDRGERIKPFSSVEQAAEADKVYEKHLKKPSLSFEALVKLRQFLLRSPYAIAELCLADIVGIPDSSGITGAPCVRRGRIVSSRDTDGQGEETVPCNLIDAFPFERCQVVATIVKRKVVYSSTRKWVQVSKIMSNAKGKDRETVEEVEAVKEVVSLIFYELDDDSGATITCLVNPVKLYGNRQFQLDESSSTLEGSRISEASDQPASDPRLWLYRIKEPPCKPTCSPPREPSVPLYEEGTVLRITARISLNARTGDRQLEALSLAKIKAEEDRYPEWHHAQRSARLRDSLYGNKQRVRNLLDLQGQKVKAAEEIAMEAPESGSDILSLSSSLLLSHAGSSLSFVSFNDSVLPNLSVPSSGTKRKKLPSLRTLVEKKVDITKERFYLYMHQHFLARSAGKASEIGQDSSMIAITMDELKADKSLDWLASKCAREEAKKLAVLREQQENDAKATKTTPSRAGLKTTRVAASSLILPSSSPLRGTQDMNPRHRDRSFGTSFSDRKEGERKVRAVWIETRKAWLFGWVVKRLHEDGIIVIYLQDLAVSQINRNFADNKSHDPETTPKALHDNLTCMMHGKEKGSIVGRNLSLTSSSPCQTGIKLGTQSQVACLYSSSNSTIRRSSNGEESYALVTPTLLLPVIGPIMSRLQARQLSKVALGAGGEVAPLKVEDVCVSLRRDEMWRYVTIGVIHEAMQLLNIQS